MTKEYKLCACPLDCLDVCSMRAEIIDGKVVNLEGNKEHPITQGFICEKGKKHIERMYSPLRIKHPMKRVNDEFVQITWDEAISTIADKLQNYIKQFGTLSIAQYNDGGAAGKLKEVENLFFNYLGDVTLFKGSLCWAAGIEAQKLDFGDVIGHHPDDLDHAKTIIVWGRNPAETNMHLMPFIAKARNKGAKLIVIDPIVTATAKTADWHIQLKPGGDWAFACAAAKYLIDNGLYEIEFAQNHTKGFEEIKAYLAELSYEKLYHIAGTTEDVLLSFVKDVLLKKPASIYLGYGIQRYIYGGTAIRAIDMLGALAGLIGKPGYGINYANKIYGSYIDWDSVSPARENHSRYVYKPRFASELPKLDNPKVKAIFISRANPVLQ